MRKASLAYKEVIVVGFFSLFLKSAKELKSVRCVATTGLLIAVSMVIEMYTIELPYCKINFAFLAIACIGMLFGPFVGFFSGLACDIVGYIAHPSGAFLLAYVLVAGLQGLIYGICLYNKADNHSIILVNNLTKKHTDITLYLRALLARLLDVVIINLLIQTKLNLHYGFINADTYGAAVIARVTKNVVELVADIPLLFVTLPVILLAYKRIGISRRAVSR